MGERRADRRQCRGARSALYMSSKLRGYMGERTGWEYTTARGDKRERNNEYDKTDCERLDADGG